MVCCLGPLTNLAQALQHRPDLPRRLGAVFVILIQTFAIDIVGAERFNTLIGLVFLAIVFVSPDGLLGLLARIKPALGPEPLHSRLPGGAALRALTQSTQGRME